MPKKPAAPAEAPLTPAEIFAIEVNAVTMGLEQLAEELAASNRLRQSGLAFAGRQTIRRLWTELHPPPPPAEPAKEPPVPLAPAPKKRRRNV